MADWWQRLVAIIIDLFLIGIPGSIILALVNGGSGGSNNGDTFGYVVVAVAGLLYFGLLDGSSRGQTVGKMLLGIATRDANTGGQVGFGRALLRRFLFDVLFWVFFIPGLVNVLSPLWDRRRQAWHDKAASTVVVKVR